MGASLYAHSPAAERIFDLAGEDIQRWCFDSSKETLRQTHITQPCIYVTTMAAYQALWEGLQAHHMEQSLEMAGLAGFSLGEYGALTAAGAIEDLQKGIQIVSLRGTLMEEAGKDAQGESKGGMVATFGDPQKVETLVEKVEKGRILQAVNYNSPQQTVVAGEWEALEDFQREAKGLGLRCKKLSVSTAFHCAMMHPAAQGLKPHLWAMDFQIPRHTIYANATGEDLLKGFAGKDINGFIAAHMAQQVESPVYFSTLIQNMVAQGIQQFIEVGPGKTLSGFVRKIAPGVPVHQVEDKASLEATLRWLKAQA